jgi:5-formyltetrahydrofolate cyclo-ligase
MTASDPNLTPTKAALRRTVKAQRQARTPAERAGVEAAIAAVALELPQLRHADCSTLYASLPDEPGTGLLRHGLRQLRVRVLLPIIVPPAESGGVPQLDWALDGDQLSPAGALGVPEPDGPRLGATELGKARVLLVPALAVDTTGTRLGRGRGYYDAALAAADPGALVLAVVHDAEVLDADSRPIPREDHDRPVHGVITPTRWMFFDPPTPTAIPR